MYYELGPLCLYLIIVTQNQKYRPHGNIQKGNPKVIRIHQLGIMNVCSFFFKGNYYRNN